ncbi:UDP-glucose 4-epimerase [Martensiomyces pterosporus]|nr:UDP-glucose 4-epimerase [Martensiomyces pterosporus]
MTASDSSSYVLVTGGAGFIGSHTVLELIRQGYKVVVVDNLCNSCEEPLRRIEKLAGLSEQIPFHKVDLADMDGLRGVFKQYSFSSVIHFAALKAVGESVKKPLAYYRNNITGTLNLLDVMIEFSVKNIVFSSSATVYKADPEGRPLREDNELGCINPYGRTKLYMEGIIRDVVDAESGWNAVMLRYFNPTGAHESGTMGEDPKQIPNNLMPYVSQVAVGKLEEVHVFGTDYNTRDGTGVRDYIHVMDLAEAHVAALKRLPADHGYEVFNLGSGSGQSVLEMIDSMSIACGHEIPYVNDPRRAGDVATVICDPTKSSQVLGFTVSRDIKQMCADLWRWQESNPSGYDQQL